MFFLLWCAFKFLLHLFCGVAVHKPHSLCFSHLFILCVLFPFARYLKDFCRMPHPLSFWKFFRSLLLFFIFFFSKSFNVVATLVCQLSKPEAKTLLQRSQLPALTTPPPPHLSVFLCLMPSASPFRCLLYLSNLWFDAPSEWSMPMWLSILPGTVQVSRAKDDAQKLEAWQMHLSRTLSIVPLECWNMATITRGTLGVSGIVSVTATASSSCPSRAVQSHI